MMAATKLVRIVDVRHKGKECFVVFLSEDRETETLWRGEAPAVGDVCEIGAEDAAPQIIASAENWPSENDALRWRKPPEGSNLTRMEILRRRACVRRAVRATLDESGFIEIDAPLLVRGTTPDGAVESFQIGDRYLATSTEYQMKRLAVGGFEKIYSLTQNFREGDAGTYRNPEFTMLEWGRVGAAMDEIEADTENFTLAAIRALDLPEVITYQGRKIDMRAPWERLSVAEAIQRITGAPMPNFEAAACRAALKKAHVKVRPSWADNRDFLFSLLMDAIQPSLGAGRPLFLTDWPLYQTTSAAPKDKKTANRSELFIAGIEIADGFAGLADVNLQMWAFNYALEMRKAAGQAPVALDEKYLDAMRLGAPYGAGMALGFDRLVMLLTDQPQIKNVLTFAWDEL
jgi:lysyl-tRNA synthetase class 2